MDRAALKSLQDGIKAGYREHPETAMITLRAEGALGEGITCSVQTGRRWPAPGCTRRPAVTVSRCARATCCCRHSRRVQA